MHDFRSSNPNNMNFNLIADTVRFFKDTQKGQKKMSAIMDELIFENNLESAKRMLQYGAPEEEILYVFPNITIENLEALKKEIPKTA